MDNVNKSSVVSAYDDLIRNTTVLTAGCEEKFLRFVDASEVSRQKWEQAELECQRLNLELAKCSQGIFTLEQKLQHARLMLDTEWKLRKKAESQRDKLAGQLQVLRQLVMDTDHGLDEVTLEKIRNIDECGVDNDDAVFSPEFNRDPFSSLVDVTLTSVQNVDELSFDDTLALCEESRTRAGTAFNRTQIEEEQRRKRYRSLSRKSILGDNGNKRKRRCQSVESITEMVEINPKGTLRSNKQGQRNNWSSTKRKSSIVMAGDRKRMNRSRSISNSIEEEEMDPELETGTIKARRNKPVHETSTSIRRSSVGVSARGNVSLRSKKRSQSVGEPVVKVSRSKLDEKENLNIVLEEVEGHSLVERTVIKPEKCMACSKRIKFGKIYLKCIHCKVSMHMECKEQAGICVAPSPSLVSSIPYLYTTPRKKEQKTTIFASPMLR